MQGDGVIILIFLILAVGLAAGVLALSFMRSKYLMKRRRALGEMPKEAIAKKFPYECGFDPVESKLPPLDVRFFLVGLLFLIFDIEVVFLFPWAMTLGVIGKAGFLSMCLFLAILTLGFVYEWRKGALDW